MVIEFVQSFVPGKSITKTNDVIECRCVFASVVSYILIHIMIYLSTEVGMCVVLNISLMYPKYLSAARGPIPPFCVAANLRAARAYDFVGECARVRARMCVHYFARDGFSVKSWVMLSCVTLELALCHGHGLGRSRDDG